MRLNYFNLGDVCYTDELNALITIFLNSVTINENIKLTEDGYIGDFGTYTTHFGELIVDQNNNPILDENGDYQYMDRVDYLNEGIVIKNYLKQPVFRDGGVTGDSNLSYWYWNTNYGTGSVSNDGTTFNATTTSYLTTSATLTSPSTSSIYVYDFPLIVEFDIVSFNDPVGITSNYSRVRVYNNANNKNAYWNFKDYGVGHYKIVCTEGSQKLYYNGVEQSRSFTFTPTTAWNVAFQTYGNIKYKNFVINGDLILDEDGNFQYEDMTGYILIDIESEFKCKFIVYFGGHLWTSSNNKIAIDLSECKYDENENPNGYLADDFIKNEFNVIVNYETPFKGFLTGDDKTISSTSELYDKILTSTDETIKLTGVYNFERDRYEIIHDSNDIININSNIILETDHDIYIVNDNNIDNKVFKVNSNGTLTINNLIFCDIKHNSSNSVIHASVIENRGELNMNKCQFINCQTNGYGTVYSYGNLNATDCKFINCRSKYGGGIFTWKDEEFYDDS